MFLSLLLSILVFPSHFTAKEPLECAQCANTTHKNCKPTLSKCNSKEDACISYFEKTTIGVKETTVFMRLCGTCDKYKPSAVRFHKGTVKSNSTCCNSTNCTPPIPTIAPDKPAAKDVKFKGNNVTCKSCYATTKSCDCNLFVECTGEERKCIHRFTTLTGGPGYTVAVRGCASAEMCEDRSFKSDFLTYKVVSDYTCTDGSDILRRYSSFLFLPIAFLCLSVPTM
ncbi:phospholipase A2 inhibitor gamma subunit B-like [Hyperolius riggenbachi]|uniref:phospholipase A2 inhibitor gamma subunit B-like n=1 Tax=Hyperolius riggenbachi TaxID=752182 RepID=UPI0035A3B9D5